MTHSQARPSFLPEDVIFESFTFPAFDLNYTPDAQEVARGFLNKPDPTPDRGRRGVYVHIPFCDTICGFCPFRKSVGTEERIATYFDALLREIEMGAATPLIRSWPISAIYLGGGTPSVLGAERIYRLIGALKTHLNVTADVEITVEVEPKSASEELLIAGREAGATRVSFGVQTLHPTLRKMVNLTASLEQIEQTAALSRKYYTDTNVDMIVGFPGQSVESAVADMAAVAALNVGSVSLFPLDYVAALPKFLNKIRSQQLPPAPVGRARWDMFHDARQALSTYYTPHNMYCFGRPEAPRCRYMFEILYGGYHDQAIGFGSGAYTMIRGLSYMNVGSEEEYVRQVGEGRMPIAQVSPVQAYEKTFVYAGKRLNADLREAFELDIQDTIMPKVEALRGAGLVTVDDNIMTLTAEGEREYAQIMVGFMSDQQRRLYDRANRRLVKDLNWGLEGPISETRSSARAMGATNALPRQTERA